MKFKIASIANAGDLERERLILRATANGDIGEYAVFRANAAPDDEALAGDIPNAYWFANREIKKGDFVVLYSKFGTSREKTSESGRTSYFYYWGLDSAIWSSTNYVAVLVNTSDWATSTKP